MTPFQLLCTLFGVIAFATACERFFSGRRRRVLSRLAAEWNMQFVAVDRFNLAQRICANLPFPGAANVCVFDIIYRTDGSRRRHLFTCEFGQGTVHSQSRRQCVAAFDEPVASEAAELKLLVAPQNVALVEQYRWARERVS